METQENLSELFDTPVNEQEQSSESILHLESVQIVRINGRERVILNTLTFDGKSDIVQRANKIAQAHSKFGAVMVIEKFEKVSATFEHNPDFNIPVDKYKKLRGSIRR